MNGSNKTKTKWVACCGRCTRTATRKGDRGQPLCEKHWEFERVERLGLQASAEGDSTLAKDCYDAACLLGGASGSCPENEAALARVRSRMAK